MREVKELNSVFVCKFIILCVLGGAVSGIGMWLHYFQVNTRLFKVPIHIDNGTRRDLGTGPGHSLSIRGQCPGHVITRDQSGPGHFSLTLNWTNTRLCGERQGNIQRKHGEKKSEHFHKLWVVTPFILPSASIPTINLCFHYSIWQKSLNLWLLSIQKQGMSCHQYCFQ